MKTYKLETIQKLDDGTHDIEGGFELPKTDDGSEQSLIIRASKYDGKTYMTISHEIDGDHDIIKEFKISKELFNYISKL
jgi:hypothetical protein